MSINIKAQVVSGNGRRYAPGDPLHQINAKAGPMFNMGSVKPTAKPSSIASSVSSLYNTSVPLPLNAVLQVGAEERARVAQASALKRVDDMLNNADAFSAAPTASPTVNAALEDLVNNFERARTVDARPSLDTAMSARKMNLTTPSMCEKPFVNPLAIAPAVSAPAALDPIVMNTPPKNTPLKNPLTGSHPIGRDYPMDMYNKEAVTSSAKDDSDSDEIQMMDLGKAPNTSPDAESAAHSYAIIAPPLHKAANLDLKHATQLGNRGAAAADAAMHSEHLINENAAVVDDADHKISAPDEVAKRAFDAEVGDGEGTKHENLNNDFSHAVQQIGEDIGGSDKTTALTNAMRCHSVCAAADQQMQTQCAELSGYDRDNVDTDRFCREMMGAIFQHLGRPNHNMGHVSKQLMDQMVTAFLTLAKLVVGMSSHEARDVISLGTRELHETVKEATKKPQAYTNQVGNKFNNHISNACRRLRKWFTFGKHDGKRFGSAAYISTVGNLAGGARTFGNGIKNAAVNTLDKIRKKIDTSRDGVARWAVDKGFMRLEASDPDKARQWLQANMDRLQTN